MRAYKTPGCIALFIFAGCSQGGYVPNHAEDGGAVDLAVTLDAAAGAKDGAAAVDAATAPDLAVPGPTAAQCLEGWRTYGGTCPAPTITESYVGNGCVGTTGWFIEGTNFQLEMHNTGIADYGPQSFGANGNQKNWNVITPTKLCVTVYAGYKSTWVGHTIYVKNPDGKMSNSVVVTDKL